MSTTPDNFMSKVEQAVTDNRKDRARRYLLGRMSDQEMVEFELQYFADHNLFEEIGRASCRERV